LARRPSGTQFSFAASSVPCDKDRNFSNFAAMNVPFVDIHTHTAKSSDNLIQIVNLDLATPCPEQGYYSCGIHPWALDKADFQLEEAFVLLEERLQSPNVLALGEAGLDKMHKESFEKQVILFERQIELSEDLQKAMILHNVKSHNEILALRKKHKVKQPWILHGFNGTEQDIKQLTGQGLYLSVGESLLHSERKIYNSFKFIDLDYLFLETDMSEVGIEKVYEAAAKVLDIDIAVLKKRLFANFARLFEHNT
jgi:TatD DNase family protein